jgi:hypothetical protein
MPIFLLVIAILIVLLLLFILAVILLTPAMDRWGATPAEIAATFAGDELVAHPTSFVNRAVTIQAGPQMIYPWIVQLGADKGGFYSYTWIEKMLMTPMVNAGQLNPQWQDLKIGDPVRMRANAELPPPYIVAQIEKERAIVMGHQEKGQWVDLWQFIMLPVDKDTTRLVLRTRTMMTGGIWSIIHPGVFLMERGMLLSIKRRAERLAKGA